MGISNNNVVEVSLVLDQESLGNDQRELMRICERWGTDVFDVMARYARNAMETNRGSDIMQTSDPWMLKDGRTGVGSSSDISDKLFNWNIDNGYWEET